MFDRTNLDTLAECELKGHPDGNKSYFPLRKYTDWKRTGQIGSLIKDTGVNKLYSNEIVPDDIGQGSLGDCWFLSAISVLAREPRNIHKLFGN